MSNASVTSIIKLVIISNYCNLYMPIAHTAMTAAAAAAGATVLHKYSSSFILLVATNATAATSTWKVRLAAAAALSTCEDVHAHKDSYINIYTWQHRMHLKRQRQSQHIQGGEVPLRQPTTSWTTCYGLLTEGCELSTNGPGNKGCLQYTEAAQLQHKHGLHMSTVLA